MIAVPLNLKQANSFVASHHRHHKIARGCKFCLGASKENKLVGVAIVSRPVARALDDGYTAELIRLCVNGTKNTASFLLGKTARICREMGYRSLITYTLSSEGGSSLRGAGWIEEGQLRKNGRGWSNRPGRKENHPEPKIRWRAY